MLLLIYFLSINYTLNNIILYPYHPLFLMHKILKILINSSIPFTKIMVTICKYQNNDSILKSTNLPSHILLYC